jgi:hypothetical protein
MAAVGRPSRAGAGGARAPRFRSAARPSPRARRRGPSRREAANQPRSLSSGRGRHPGAVAKLESTRRKCVRPNPPASGAPATAGMAAASTSRYPASLRRAGRTNRWNVAKADAGFPVAQRRGAAIRPAAAAAPAENGLPGRIFTRQKSVRTPSAASTSPEQIRRPHGGAADRHQQIRVRRARPLEALADGGPSSGTGPSAVVSAPASAQSASSIGPFVSGMPDPRVRRRSGRVRAARRRS